MDFMRMERIRPERKLPVLRFLALLLARAWVWAVSVVVAQVVLARPGRKRGAAEVEGNGRASDAASM